MKALKMLCRLVIVVFLLISGVAKAACPFAEQAEKSGKINIAFMQYIYCAEEENDAEAQYKLGSMFYQGVGLPHPDFRRAVAFFSRAANNGYAPAQVKLGLLYWRGEGITKNLKMAHKWLYLAQEPENMRWFYYVGPSFDKTAASVYEKLNSIIKTSDKDFTEDAPFASTVPLNALGDGFLPSYREVAEFQHENLIQAGEEFLDASSQNDLRKFLNGLLPGINPKFPSSLSDDEKQRALQMILNWFKPVLLTTQNFDPAKVPVLEKLKREIEMPVE